MRLLSKTRILTTTEESVSIYSLMAMRLAPTPPQRNNYRITTQFSTRTTVTVSSHHHSLIAMGLRYESSVTIFLRFVDTEPQSHRHETTVKNHDTHNN